MLALWHRFAQQVDKILRDDPDITVARAVANARNVMALEGYVSSQIDTMIVEFQKHSNPPVKFGAVANPQFLEHQLGKHIYLYLVTGGIGVFGTISEIADRLQGDISRYVTYGPTDSLLVQFGNSEEASALEIELQGRNLIVDVHRVTKVHLFKGYPVTNASMISRSQWGLLSPDTLELLDLLVNDYSHSDLAGERERFLNSSVILGREIVDDPNMKGYARAFVGVNLYDRPKRPAIERYVQTLLRQPIAKHGVRSVYECDGTYSIFFELLCADLIELDQLTDEMALGRKWALAGQQVETETLVVARVAKEVLPTAKQQKIKVPTIADTVYVAFVRDLQTQYIDPLSEELRDKWLLLDEESRIFLLNVLTEFRGLDQLTVPNDIRHELHASQQAFLRGYIGEVPAELANSIVAMGRAVEASCRHALKHVIELLYKGNQGLAQQQLGMSTSKPFAVTLGKFNAVFEAINKHPYYQSIDVTFSDYFRNNLSFFTQQRNQSAHSSDYPITDRSVMQAIFLGRDCIQWLQYNIFTKEITPTHAVSLFRQVMTERQAEHDFATQVGMLLGRNKEDILTRLEQILNEISSDNSRQFAEVLAELARLASTGAASQRREERWRQIAEALVANQEEILKHMEASEVSAVSKVITGISSSVQNISLGIIANSIFEVLLRVEPSYVPTLIGIIEDILKQGAQ